jgi:rare lipoprotein A
MKLISMILWLLIAGCTPLNKNTPSTHDDKIKTDKKSSYRVYGKRYHVLKSSHNYEEKGVASWYGKRFNKKRTSSGERYNMNKMTAAHKTLPLASKVLVMNLKNGKQITVRINDRGPFVNNRLIDLSYAAAKKLGMVGAGTTSVRIKALEKQPK